MTTRDKSPGSFSLRQLFIATFVVAVLIPVAKVLGLPAIATLASFLLALLCTRVAWLFAKQSDRTVPFWHCIGAWIWLILNPFHMLPAGTFSGQQMRTTYRRGGYQWWMRNEEHLVIFSVLFGVGVLLAFSALRRGHWSTRLLVLPVLFFLYFQLDKLSVIPFVSLDEVVEYWTTADLNY